MNIIEAIEQDYKRDDIPAFGVGDTLKVYIKIKEGNRERVQMFEGFVLKIQNGGLGKTFTRFLPASAVKRRSRFTLL